MGTSIAKDGYARSMEVNMGRMDAQLELWAAQLDNLTARAKKGGAHYTIEYRQSLDDLKARRAVAQAKVDELKAAGSEKWEEFKEGIGHAWSDLEAAFRDLKS